MKFIGQWFWESELSLAIIMTHNSRVDFRINFVSQKTSGEL